MASRRTRIKGIANIPQRRKTTNGTNPEENAKLSPEIGEHTGEEPNLNLEHEISQEENKIEECLTNEKEIRNDIVKNDQPKENIPHVDVNVENKFQRSPILEKCEANFSSPIQNDAYPLKNALDDVSAIDKLLKSPLNTDLNHKNQELFRCSNNNKESSLQFLEEGNNSVKNDKLDRKSVVPVRRKFLKPTVSVNAISRKPKGVEEIKPTVINNSINGRNSKIVILNEVISYPNQNQHVVIQNHQTEGDLHVLACGDRNGGYVSPEVGNNLYKIPEVGSTVYKTPESGSNGYKPAEINNGRTFANSFERDIKRLVPQSPQLLTPETEYPIPPPSPNKINRSRIKAVPRLGQRNTSVSASESEDESRRNYRHRNDSVCSSASGLQDTNSIPECLSPQKPKEFNSVIQRKCRRTEQSRKLAEARRDFYLKFGNNKPDRQKLTMIDLIFYNPVTNPMSSDTKKRKTSEGENESKEEAKVEEENVDDPGKAGSDEENEIPAPQIKIGPSGEIVVDEQSLVIENKQVKKSREELEKSEVVNGDFETGYGVYKRAKRSKDWSKKETLKFYKALNTIGTDFTLMCELFPRRSRRELKMKFKKEERVNKALVDKAIMQPCGFDFADFKHQVDMEEKELLELEKQKERERVFRQEAAKKRKAVSSVAKESNDKPKVKKKKTLDILNVLEDSDADESEVESVEGEETENNTLLQTIQKPTRSGRIPKILNKYKAPNPDGKSGNKKAEPGSLIVVASTGPNGQPVYKVCMVTGEHDRQQIGDDMSSLEKALECKENGITSLFTLSATAAEEDASENNQTIPAEENNVTIPAEGIC